MFCDMQLSHEPKPTDVFNHQALLPLENLFSTHQTLIATTRASHEPTPTDVFNHQALLPLENLFSNHQTLIALFNLQGF